MLAAKFLFDKCFQPIRCDRIRYNGSTLIAFESDCSSHSNKAVAVDLLTIGVNSPPTVNVCIEYNTEISSGCLYCSADRSHSFFVFGVRDMVREHSVRLQELTAVYVCTKCFQNVSCEESACTISSVNYNFEALERMIVITLIIYISLDLFTQNKSVAAHEITVNPLSKAALFRRVAVLSMLQNSNDVLIVKTAVTGEEFKTVTIIGMVACSYLQSAVTAKLYSGHEHCRSRS